MSALVTAARAYMGVPFRHRGRTRRGLDCAGLAWLAYRDCGVTLEDFRLYGREPHNDGLVARISGLIGDPVRVAPVSQADLQPGDVIVFRFVKEPHHVGIVTDYPYGGALGVIHASGEEGEVVEHRLPPDFIERITHVFRRPV